MKSYYDGDLIIFDDGDLIIVGNNDLINHNLCGFLGGMKSNIIYKAFIILHISDNMTIKCLKNRFACPTLNVFTDDVNEAIIDFKRTIKLKLRNKKLKRIINDNN